MWQTTCQQPSVHFDSRFCRWHHLGSSCSRRPKAKTRVWFAMVSKWCRAGFRPFTVCWRDNPLLFGRDAREAALQDQLFAAERQSVRQEGPAPRRGRVLAGTPKQCLSCLCVSYGYGSKLSQQGTTGSSLSFRLPGFHCGSHF